MLQLSVCVTTQVRWLTQRCDIDHSGTMELSEFTELVKHWEAYHAEYEKKKKGTSTTTTTTTTAAAAEAPPPGPDTPSASLLAK
jgi:hypothetical protein